MPRARRIAIGLTLTAVLLAGAAAWTIGLLRVWDARGWTGVAMIHNGSRSRKILGVGRVLMVYGGSPAERAGIRAGDRILTIDGIAVSQPDALAELDARVRTGDTVTYVVNSNGRIALLPVTVASPIRATRFLIEAAVTLAIAACFLMVGLVVFLRRSDDRRAVVFYAMVVAAALSLLASVGHAGAAADARGIAVQPESDFLSVAILSFFSLSFLPITLHLALIFPHDRPVVRRRPYIIRWIYGLPVAAALIGSAFGVCVWLTRGTSGAEHDALLPLAIALAAVAVVLAAWMLRRVRRDGFRAAVVRHPIPTLLIAVSIDCALLEILDRLDFHTFVLIILGLMFVLPVATVALYPIAACMALVRSYREASVEEKRQVRWPLWGTFSAIFVKIACFALMIGWSVLLMLRPSIAGSYAALVTITSLAPRVLSLLIPLSFAAAILKYRLMNIDIIIKKTVVYGLLSGLLIVLYLILVGGIGTLLVRVAGVENQTMVVASTLVLALLFVPLRNRVQTLIDRNFFRQRYDYPQALRAIGTETVTATDLGAFLQFAAETLQQALQLRGIAIFMLRQSDYVATAKVGYPDSILGTLRIADSTELRVLLDRPFAPHRRQMAEADAAVLRRIEARLVVPVRTPTAVQGFLAIGEKLSDRELDLDDLDFLASAADQIAIGADRIRLQREEVEFEQARDMQRTLLPRELPRVPGFDVAGAWEPARTVGGDYYDCLDLGGGQLAVCIGDVAGKGMPAALLMASLQAAVRASAERDVSPAALCDRVRRVVVSSLTGGRFVTFFVGILDAATRTLRYCNAGHNPPVLVRADGGTNALARGGPVFSRLFRNVSYEEESLPLAPGDRVVLFTDGMTEARNAAGEDLGEERLVELIAANRALGARELQHAVLDAVSAFARGRFEDDVTMVVVASEV
jgi:serine phosphatase RsbU (regulator of sigma subunit)